MNWRGVNPGNNLLKDCLHLLASKYQVSDFYTYIFYQFEADNYQLLSSVWVFFSYAAKFVMKFSTVGVSDNTKMSSNLVSKKFLAVTFYQLPDSLIT